MKTSRIALLVGLLAALGAFMALDLGQWLSLERLQRSQTELAVWYAREPLRVAGLYCALYVAVAALSLPGAAVLTVAGGAVFGLGWGLCLVSFASSLGALLAFLGARFVLRDSVEAWLGRRLDPIHRGLEKEGAFYLFSLRLVPLLPFFVLNLAMGLTRMRAWTFYWVSQLGMLAGTAVFVNAGTQLASLNSLRGVLSPGLLASLVLLGLFPWLARRGVSALQGRQVYARWAHARPRRFERNLVVIGAGAGGLVSAYIAAAVRARVTLVEAGRMGGDCLNTGCVPSKALIQSARLAWQMRQAGAWGLGDAPAPIDFKAVMARVQAVIRAVEPHDSVDRYTGLGVEVLQGRATLVDPWTVQIALNDGGQRTLSTRSIVIAAGASPVVPDLPGIADSGYLTSDTLWDALAGMDHAPGRLLVLGGGPVGCELAQALARLGSTVTLLEAAPRLLPREDAEVSRLVQDALQADGVHVLTGHSALRCERVGATRSLLAQAAGGDARRIDYDLLLCATGRAARLSGYGLEALGIGADSAGRLETNAYLQTRYPHIYAAGDVVGPHQFTHAAAHQAWYATVNALFGGLRRFPVDYSVLPRVTFTDPEVARVGLSEQEATAQGVPFEVSRFPMAELDRAIADGDTRGFVKVLTVPGRDRILGVCIVGAQAGELLAEYVLAMRHGLGLGKILGTVHAYPTRAEAAKYAAGVWRRAHAPERLLAWARRYHDWRRR